MTHSIADLIMLSEKLFPTRLLPEHIKSPGQALAVMLAGQELGMQPMESFRSLTLVKGKVVESADSQLGRFKGAGGKAAFTTLTDDLAVLELTHPNGDTHTESFSIEDARRARLTGDNWAKYPKAMLRSRCITAGLKSLGWTGAAGAYDPEEAEEIGAPRYVSSLPEPVRESEARQIAAQKALAAPESDVEVEVVPAPGSEGIVDPEPITFDPDTGEIIEKPIGPFISEAQRKALWAHARKFHVSEQLLRDKLRTLGIESTKEIPQALFLGVLDWIAEGEGVQA